MFVRGKEEKGDIRHENSQKLVFVLAFEGKTER